jgi:UPF0176 protein
MTAIFPVILFYKYVTIEDPDGFVETQRSLCSKLGLKGRILVACEGINGTLAGPAEAIESYVNALRSDLRFSDIEIKSSPGNSETFPRLIVRTRSEIVTSGAGPDFAPDLDNHLAPAEWKRMLEEDQSAVIVDVRNNYESEVGRFEGAITCDIDNFRDLAGYLDKLNHLKERKVLMYCTGGIRCEKASALFRSRGFKTVFQLHGGIMTYQKEFGNEHWLGECFVFDRRMTVRVEHGLVQLGRCAHTGRETSRYVNCLHDPCHRLFLLSAEAENENPNFKLCPDCLDSGLTVESAVYKREKHNAVPKS